MKYAAAFASGLAVENAVLQAYLRPGDEIIPGMFTADLPDSEQRV